MRRLPAEDEGAGAAGSAWLLPFAALLLLVFALFVILFAGSQADVKKTEKLVSSLRVAFGTQVEALSELPFRPQPGAEKPTSPTPGGAQPESALTQKLAHAVEGLPQAKLIAAAGGIWRLRIPAEVLFDPAAEAPTLLESRFAALDRLGEALKATVGEGSLRLLGHAAGPAELAAEKREAAQLSFARAYALASYWQKRLAWNEASLEVVARGAVDPVLEDPAQSARVELEWRGVSDSQE